MGHLRGGDHGDFHHSGNVAVGVAPGRLVDDLVHAVFLNGVGVAFAGGKHVADFRYRCFGMALEEVFADEIAVGGECVA